MKVIRIDLNTEGESIEGWHMNHPLGFNGITLCGFSWDDAPEYKRKDGKVTCVPCLSIIKACKKVRIKN